MKILVLSDSHGNTENILCAIERTNPDLLIFLGDGLRDLQAVEEQFPTLRIESVPGNCDLFSHDAPERLLVEGGVTILACHGHAYGVKGGYLDIAAAARERGADVVLFGHTHRVHCETHNRLTMLNPGSIGDYRFPSYGVLTVENGRCSADTFLLSSL